jgi:hypothetical protein
MFLTASSTPAFAGAGSSAVLAHADHHKKRDRGRLAVEPHAHHRAVEDQPHDRLGGEITLVPGVPVRLHLPPHPADHVLADALGEHRRQRPAHPARVGAGQIGRRDQRVGSERAALVGAKPSALPLARCAVLAVEAGPGHRDLGRPEGAGQTARATAVAVTRDRSGRLLAGLPRRPAAVARARQSGGELLLDHRLDEAAHLGAQAVFDGIKPGVEKQALGLTGPSRRDIARHGVVSTPALQRRNQQG